jgi:hypothetical protein
MKSPKRTEFSPRLSRKLTQMDAMKIKNDGQGFLNSILPSPNWNPLLGLRKFAPICGQGF